MRESEEMKRESYYILLSFGEIEPGEFQEYIRGAKPDMIELEALRGTGYAFYPSKIAPVSPDLVGDPIATWAKICREEGVKVGIYLAAWRSGDPRNITRGLEVDKDGNVKPACHCYNGPWTDEFLIPLMYEIIDRYSPTHFWLDGVWLDGPCYCDYCESKFKEKYGYPLPKEPNKLQRYDLLEFMESSVDEAIEHLAKKIKEKSPNVKIACNTTYYFKELRKPVGVDWLSWDYLNTADWRNLSFQATYLSTAGKPADIMVFENSRFWDQNNIYVARLRSITHLKTEASSILAHGLIFHLWQNPNPDGTLGSYKKRVAKEIGKFIRERCDWCVGNESIAEVAILASRKEHLLYWGPAQPRSSNFFLRHRGIHQILKEGHIPCEIVRDDTFTDRMKQYRLVILPETITIYKETTEKLKLFASLGGSILIIGKPAEKGEEPYLHLITKDEEEMASSTGGFVEIRERIFLYPSNIISEYITAPRRAIREQVLQPIQRILKEKLQLKIKAPPGVEVVMNRRSNDIFVHFVNHVPGKIMHEINERYFDDVTTIHGIQAEVHTECRPKSVTLTPHNQPLDFSYKDGYISIELPPLEHHMAIKISTS